MTNYEAARPSCWLHSLGRQHLYPLLATPIVKESYALQPATSELPKKQLEQLSRPQLLKARVQLELKKVAPKRLEVCAY